MDEPNQNTMVAVDPRHVSYTHLMYALHSLALLVAALTAANIASRFVFGWPSIVAVIMNYLRRSDVRGTWLESHFRWQLRTFWISFLLVVFISPLFLTIILAPLVLAVYAGIGAWAIYRIARGWLALRDAMPLPVPAT